MSANGDKFEALAKNTHHWSLKHDIELKDALQECLTGMLGSMQELESTSNGLECEMTRQEIRLDNIHNRIHCMKMERMVEEHNDEINADILVRRRPSFGQQPIKVAREEYERRTISAISRAVRQGFTLLDSLSRADRSNGAASVDPSDPSNSPSVQLHREKPLERPICHDIALQLPPLIGSEEFYAELKRKEQERSEKKEQLNQPQKESVASPSPQLREEDDLASVSSGRSVPPQDPVMAEKVASGGLRAALLDEIVGRRMANADKEDQEEGPTTSTSSLIAHGPVEVPCAGRQTFPGTPIQTQEPKKLASSSLAQEDAQLANRTLPVKQMEPKVAHSVPPKAPLLPQQHQIEAAISRLQIAVPKSIFSDEEETEKEQNRGTKPKMGGQARREEAVRAVQQGKHNTLLGGTGPLSSSAQNVKAANNKAGKAKVRRQATKKSLFSSTSSSSDSEAELEQQSQRLLAQRRPATSPPAIRAVASAIPPPSLSAEAISSSSSRGGVDNRGLGQKGSPAASTALDGFHGVANQEAQQQIAEIAGIDDSGWQQEAAAEEEENDQQQQNSAVQMSKPVFKTFEANFSDRLAAAIQHGPVAFRPGAAPMRRPVSAHSIPSSDSESSAGGSARPLRKTESSVSSNDELGPATVKARIAQIGAQIPIGGRRGGQREEEEYQQQREQQQRVTAETKAPLPAEAVKTRAKGPARRAPTQLARQSDPIVPSSTTAGNATSSLPPRPSTEVPKMETNGQQRHNEDDGIAAPKKAVPVPPQKVKVPPPVKEKTRSIFSSSSSDDDLGLGCGGGMKKTAVAAERPMPAVRKVSEQKQQNSNGTGTTQPPFAYKKTEEKSTRKGLFDDSESDF